MVRVNGRNDFVGGSISTLTKTQTTRLTKSTNQKQMNQQHTPVSLCPDAIKSILSFLPSHNVNFDNPRHLIGKLHNGELILVCPNITIEACYISIKKPNAGGMNTVVYDTDNEDKLFWINMWFRYACVITVTSLYGLISMNHFPSFFIFMCAWAKNNANLSKTKSFRFEQFSFDYDHKFIGEFTQYSSYASEIFQRTQLVNFRNWFYGSIGNDTLLSKLPNNCTLVVVSDFRDNRLFESIEKHFHGKTLILHANHSEGPKIMVPLKSLLENQNLKKLSIQSASDMFDFHFEDVVGFVNGRIKINLKSLCSPKLLDKISSLDEKMFDGQVESITELELTGMSNMCVMNLFPNAATSVYNFSRHTADYEPQIHDLNMKNTKIMVEYDQLRQRYTIAPSVLNMSMGKNDVALVDSQNLQYIY
jgi:hypothetical protein